MRDFEIALLIALAYILGSLPFGLWVCRLIKGKHFDIRDWGSHNVGATNVLRVLGWQASIPVFLLDTAKGYVPTLIALHFFGFPVAIICMGAAVIGHAESFITFIMEGKFGGGKSVATVFGGILALQPLIAGVALFVFLISVITTRYVSLSSLLGSLSALVVTIATAQSWYWVTTLVVVFFFLVFTHRTNILRLLSKTEPKFGEKRGAHGLGGEAVSAFDIHALSMDDFLQNPVAAWIIKLLQKAKLTQRDINKIILSSQITSMVGDVTGIRTKNGLLARSIIQGVFLLPEMIKDENNELLLEGIIKNTAVQAKRSGASILGLGGLLSTIKDLPLNLQNWSDKRGFTLVVDNGGACTAAATFIALIRARPNLKNLKVAIVGASGVIGAALRFYLQREHISTILLARDERKLGDAEKLETIAKGLEDIKDADVVILATSSVDPIISIEKDTYQYLKPGALVLDVARPADFDENVLIVRPDIELIRCGLIHMPGAKCQIDFHFGTIDIDNSKEQLFPACLAQVVILSLTGEYKRSTKGLRINPEEIDWYINRLDEFGFEVITSQLDEYSLFSGGVS